MLALLIELWHPGVGRAGADRHHRLGAWRWSPLGTLPMNWVGVGLIGWPWHFIFLDVHIPGTSAFGIGGVIAFVLGSLMLFSGLSAPSPTLPSSSRCNPWLVGTQCASLMGSALLALAYLVRTGAPRALARAGDNGGGAGWQAGASGERPGADGSVLVERAVERALSDE